MTTKTRKALTLLEQMHDAKVVTYQDREGKEQLGGMCACCGSSPVEAPDWRVQSWCIFRAGICDSDGIYYSMLCEGCLGEIRVENAKRTRTERDAQAEVITELLAEDIDGAQAMMEDLEYVN